jgi:hypothetical protein
MMARWSWVTPATWTAIICLLGFSYGGIGLSLCLLAVLLLAATMQRCLPPLAGPVRWAASSIVFALYCLGAGVVVTLLPERTLSRSVALVVLGLPSIVCAVTLVWATRRPMRLIPIPARLGRNVAATIAVAVLAVPNVARWKGGAAGIVWAMSGDNRNHVMGARSVISSGGLTVDQLHGYPSGAYGLIALITSANGREGLTPADLLTQDIRALASVWILVAIGVGVLCSTAVVLSLPSRELAADRLTPPAAISSGGAGLLVGTGLFSGVALHDGFLPAFGGNALLLAAVCLGIPAWRSPHPTVSALLLGDALVEITYRPLFAPVTVALLLATLLRVQRLHRWAIGWWPVAVGTLCLATGLGVYFFGSGRTALRLSLEAPGAIAPPNAWVVAVLSLLALGLSLTPQARDLGAAMFPVLVVLAGLIVLVAWSEHGVTQLAPGFSYSSAKLVWGGCMIAAWLPFACIARVTSFGAESGLSLLPRLRLAAAAGTLSIAGLLAVSVVSPALPPARAIVSGSWIRPSAASIDLVLDNLNRGAVVVPWLYVRAPDGISPIFAEDRSGIFWSMTQWDPAVFASFNDWAYNTIFDGNAATLCPLVQSVKGVVVLTRDPDLERRTRGACGADISARFIVEPAPPPAL